MALIIGITGGIGSGKTLITNIFSALSIPVFNSDLAGRLVLNNSEEVKAAIVARWGNDMYINNIPNRKLIAQKVFNNKSELEFLNALIHPCVRSLFSDFISENTDSKYVIYESAILFESGFSKETDLNILITAPLNERIERVIKRDNAQYNDVLARINNQWSDEQKSKLAQHTILNGKNDRILPQILSLHNLFLEHHGKIQ
jgi:dephospho-CoA kinase